jgi:hypothetical protein
MRCRSRGQASPMNGNTANAGRATKTRQRHLGARGDGNAQANNPYYQEVPTATVPGGPASQTHTDKGVLEEWVREATSTAGMPTWNPSPRGEGEANGTGERDGTTIITTRSRFLWTHTWNGTMDESTWQRCLAWRESSKRIYQHYRVSAMQTANRFCAGTARWDGACIANVATYGKAAIRGPMTPRTILPRKYVRSSAGGSKHVCNQGAGMGCLGRGSKRNQSLKPPSLTNNTTHGAQ